MVYTLSQSGVTRVAHSRIMALTLGLTLVKKGFSPDQLPNIQTEPHVKMDNFSTCFCFIASLFSICQRRCHFLWLWNKISTLNIF